MLLSPVCIFNVMYRFVCLAFFIQLLSWTRAGKSDNERKEPSVFDMADSLIHVIKPDDNNATNITQKITRLADLKDKILHVESYVVDRDQYSQLLMNQIKSSNLTETSFYKALQGPDNFLMQNDSKNVYLQMKERMNRDDLLEILANRGASKVKLSARKMMQDSYIPKRYSETKLSEAVDKYLGETPRDNHKFYDNSTNITTWDPQLELESRLAHRRDGRRLFKGERTTIRHFPFMVSVHIMGRFWCGGVLYSDDLVITSASCLQLLHNNRFFRENPRALAIRVGSNHSRIGGELVDALEVFFHPSYNPRTLKNNIAIVRLVRRLKLSYHTVPARIDISKSKGMAFTSEVLLLGWGVTKTSQKLQYEPIYLQEKYLPVYPAMFCKEVYGDKYVQEDMFCAGTVSTGEGACDHDAGGPAVLDGFLVGIISFGPTVCGFPDAPTVFTLVGAYVDWIETIEASMSSHFRARKRTTTTTEDPFVAYFQKTDFHPMDALRMTVPQKISDVSRNKKDRKMKKHEKKKNARMQKQEKKKKEVAKASAEAAVAEAANKEVSQEKSSAKTQKTGRTNGKNSSKPITRSKDRHDLSNFKVIPRTVDERKEDRMFIDFGDKSIAVERADEDEEKK